MALPRENSAWPPREWAPAFDRYRLNEGIWLNDTELLGSLLRGGSINSDDGRRLAEQRKRNGILVNLMRRWGWAQITPTNERRTDLPVPIGASVADLSAAQLMSEAPMVRLFTTDKTGEVTKRARVKSDQQNRLDVICNSDDAHMTLLEGAQITAAIGGSVMKAAWDTEDPDRESVWFDIVGADVAVPEFNSSGRLVAVILWQEYAARGEKVYRHLERHAAGVIEHALYLGTKQSIGRLERLDRVDELASLLATPKADSTDNVLSIGTGLSRPTAQFWRNRPTRGWRHSGVMAHLGRSDFELVEPLLDSYSEAWGSMMRDVRLGKARAFVPIGTLERLGAAGTGGIFDADREFYQEVGGLNPEMGADQIRVEQPTIRWQEHMKTLAGLKLEILDAVGWSLSSYGNPMQGSEGGGVTATEVVDRTTKSERTRDEKALLFKSPANPFFRMLSELDGLLYPGAGGGPITDELSIDFPDVSQVDPEKQARTFMDNSTAHAMSIDQMVRERRPNWDDDEVKAEVDRIFDEIERLTGTTMPTDPTQIGRTGGKITLTDPAGTDAPPAGDELAAAAADAKAGAAGA